MSKQCIIVSTLALCLCVTSLFSQEKKKNEKRETLEEVVISATKFKLKKENTGKVIYTIANEDIKRNAGKSVIDILNNVTGIEIRGTNSNPGEPRAVSIRGGRGRQVLVLIDGVPVTDPTGVEQSFDLRLLSLNQIDYIEVLKGASSSLYGTGAGSGVINIILKKASKAKITGTYEVSLGSNNTSKNRKISLTERNQNISINGTRNNFSYNAYFSLSGIDGMSSAKSNSNTVFEKDAYNSKNGYLNLSYKLNEHINIQSFLNYDGFYYDYDSGAYNDSDVNQGQQNQIRFGIRPTFKYSHGELFLNTAINILDRKFSSFNSFIGGINEFSYQGENINLDFVNKYDFSDSIQLITGLNYQYYSNETISDFGNIDANLANLKMIDPYLSAVFISNFGLSVNLGSRLNIHNHYGNNFVYDGNVAFEVLKSSENNLKLITSYSTAFIAPSLYQLFSDYGVIDLKPETSRTIEAGFEFNFMNALKINMVYFDRVEEDKVIFKNLAVSPFGVYANATNTIKTNGIETDFSYEISNVIKATLGYTYINKSNDIDYIPANKMVAAISGNITENLSVSVVFKTVGKRTFFDAFGSFGVVNQTIVLPSYRLLDVNANYKLLHDKVMVFASITNVFNEDYEETLGFNTRGRNFKVGVRLRL